MNNTPGPCKSTRLHVVADSADSLLTDRTDEWDRLAGGVPFRQSMWLRPLWQHFGESKRSCFLTVVDGDDRMRGILPLERYGSRGWQSIGSVPCTDHVSVLCQQSDRHCVAEALADFLITHSRDPQVGWDRLHFEGVIGGDPAMSALIDALDRRNASVRIQSRMSVWFRSTVETWDQFLSSRSRNHRHRLRQQIRRFESADQGMRIQFPANEEELTRYVNELIRLHQLHWQAKGESGSYATEKMVKFIHDAAREAFGKERLFLPVLIRTDPDTAREEILAVQIHFVGEDGRLYCYSTGVNYEHAERKPGVMLNTYMLRQAHQSNFAGVDFMRGDEEYKRRRYAQPGPLLIIDVFAPTRIGRLKQTGFDNFSLMKQRYRSFRNRPLSTVYGIEDAFDSTLRSTLPRHVDPIEQDQVLAHPSIAVPAIHSIGEYSTH